MELKRRVFVYIIHTHLSSNPDRPIAQPRRRLNRTTSTSSIGSVGSAPGNTSPMGQFGYNSPSNAAAGKPPGQPAFGSPFGTPASTTSPFGMQQQQQQQQPSTLLGFGSILSSPPATAVGNAPPSSMGFGGFVSPAVPSSTPVSTSTTEATAPTFGGGFGMNTSASPFGGASNTSTTTGFQSGFGSNSSSGNAFGGFGKRQAYV